MGESGGNRYIVRVRRDYGGVLALEAGEDE